MPILYGGNNTGQEKLDILLELSVLVMEPSDAPIEARIKEQDRYRITYFLQHHPTATQEEFVKEIREKANLLIQVPLFVDLRF